MKFKIYLSTLAALFLHTRTEALSSITDTLVTQLDCENLSINTILEKVDRTKAFSTSRHFPVNNWSFDNGPYNLGVCWSLSHAQRLFFYFGREQENPEAIPSHEDTLDALNQLRGSVPMKTSFKKIKELILNQFSIFKLNDFSPANGLWQKITEGIWDSFDYLPRSFRFDLSTYENYFHSENSEEDPRNLGPLELVNGKLFRSFKTEIERYQRWRFHRPTNTKLLTEKVPRPKDINKKLAVKLMKLLDQNRLPLVDIKPNLYSQHIVIVKDYIIAGDKITFFVYDSNLPYINNEFSFDKNREEFQAPEIIQRFPKVTNPNQDISLYLVDQEDQDLIEKSLLSHYQKLCEANL